MFKMLDRLVNHWAKKQSENKWYLFVIMGEMIIFTLGSLYISYMIAPYVVQNPCFSRIERFEVAFQIWLAFEILVVSIMFAGGSRTLLVEKKAEKRLKNRDLLDYVAKYQKYVEFVESAIQSGEYKEVYLPNDWVKVFDKHLDMTANLRTSEKQDFTDFDVMACLMYALTYENDEDGRIINVPFAFHCAKAFLRVPNVYECKRIEGYELVLEPIESLKEVSFETIDTSALLEIQEMVSVYLSQRKYYSQALELADFLHIFYLRCDK